MSEVKNTPMPGERFLDQRKNADKPAFGEAESAGDMAIKHGGLTKREYAAVQAMTSMTACAHGMPDDYDRVASVAWAYADALFSHDDAESKK